MEWVGKKGTVKKEVKGNLDGPFSLSQTTTCSRCDARTRGIMLRRRDVNQRPKLARSSKESKRSSASLWYVLLQTSPNNLGNSSAAEKK